MWFFKNNTEIDFDNAHRYSLTAVPLRKTNKPVRIDAEMVDLIGLIKNQNFVPVIDDMDKFIGIVRRSDVIDFCAQQLFHSNKPS